MKCMAVGYQVSCDVSIRCLYQFERDVSSSYTLSKVTHNKTISSCFPPSFVVFVSTAWQFSNIF